MGAKDWESQLITPAKLCKAVDLKKRSIQLRAEAGVKAGVAIKYGNVTIWYRTAIPWIKKKQRQGKQNRALSCPGGK